MTSKTSGFASPSTSIMPTAPFASRPRLWSTISSVPGHFHLEVDDRRAASGDQRRLDVADPLRLSFRHDPVEDLADDVEAGDDVRATDPEEDAHRLADLRLEGVIAGDRADSDR